MGNWISYIIILILSYIFTYIFELKENYVLLYMIIIAPIIDGLLFIYFGKVLDAKVTCEVDSIEKNTCFLCNVEIENHGWVPIPFVDYEIKYNNNVISDENNITRVSIGGREKEELELRFRAIHRGVGGIELSSICIRSLLGLFKKNIESEECINKIAILPSLIELDGSDYLVDNKFEESQVDDGETNIIVGEPGYEFKEYSEGDPLNRVNWKLSSKKNLLMIRKSISNDINKKVVILDPLILKSKDVELVEDLIIEGFISIIDLFINNDLEVDIVIGEKTGWRIFSSSEIESIVWLQNYFSYYEFIYSKNNRFRKLALNEDKKSDYIIFTSNKDNELGELVRSLEVRSDKVIVVSNDKRKAFEEELYLKMDYSLEGI